MIVLRVPELSGRSAQSLRHYWNSRPIAVMPTPTAQPPLTPNTVVFAWPPFPAPKRDRRGGRPWSFFVDESCLSPRPPTQRQHTLLQNWGLLGPSPIILLCNLQRAESIAKSYLVRLGSTGTNRELLDTFLGLPLMRRLGAIYTGADVCHTLTSSNSNLYWVLLPGRSGAFLGPAALASFMGMGRRGCYTTARRLISSDYTLSYCIAESVHARLANYCAMSAVVLAGSALSTIGSLYSGAFDALAEGFVSVGTPLSRLFAAERDVTKQKVLRASYAYLHIYSSAMDAASYCPNVDVLVASPPCHEVSSARRSESTVEADSLATEAVDSHLSAITACITRAEPRIFIVEQSSGLLTHHRSTFDNFDAAIKSIGYRVLFLDVDAAADLQSTHARRRLIWLGVRVES